MQRTHSVDWANLQSVFADGSPVMAIGPGCHRIGYDESEGWQRVVRRAGAVWHQIGEAPDGDAEARQEFLVRFWLAQLCEGDATSYNGRSLPKPSPRMEIRNRSDGADPAEKGRIVLAAKLLCALVDMTRALGAAVETGSLPVMDWQQVIADEARPDDRSSQLLDSAAGSVREAVALTKAFGAVLRNGVGDEDRAMLRRHGLAAEDVEDDKLALLKIESVGAALEELVDVHLGVSSGQVSGAVVEWFADLFWHVVVSGAGVPPSQDELSFYLNLRKMPYSRRRFSRPSPGEYRGELDGHGADQDGGATLRRDLSLLLSDIDSGIDEQPRDWTNPREEFALSMASSLVETWREEGDRRLTTALISDYDLMFDRALFECLEDGESFHVLVPVVAKLDDPTPPVAFRWLYGTIVKGEVGVGGEVGQPVWEWFEEVAPVSKRRPKGPIVIRLTGSPLYRSGSVEELGLPQHGSDRIKRLDAAAIFSEHDSVRAIVALTRPSPVGVPGAQSLFHGLFGPQGLTWNKRSWVFFGHRFSDWLPRLQLLFTALMLAEGAAAEDQGQSGWKDEVPANAIERIAISRSFDWPEQALLDALKITMQEVDLKRLSRYFDQKSTHHENQLGESRNVTRYLQRVRAAVDAQVRAEVPVGVGAVAQDEIGSRGARGDEVPRPRVFISYSHEGEGRDGPWMSQVRSLADLLYELGFDIEFDQWGNHLGRDWSQWGPNAVLASDCVLCVASPEYEVRWRDEAKDGSRGSSGGAAGEARAIRSAYDNETIDGYLFVVLPGRNKRDIPENERGRQYELVSQIDDDGVEMIIRWFTDQALFERPKRRLQRPQKFDPQ